MSLVYILKWVFLKMSMNHPRRDRRRSKRSDDPSSYHDHPFTKILISSFGPLRLTTEGDTRLRVERLYVDPLDPGTRERWGGDGWRRTEEEE